MAERRCNACNVLVSFPYCTPDVLEVVREWGAGMRWLLDCGAYTALQAGKAVDLDRYIEFVHEVKPWAHFSLDVIGDPKRTHENYRTMREAGLAPVPVLTIGDGPETVERHYPEAEYVAVAGINGKDGVRSVLRVSEMVSALPTRRLHLLGFTLPHVLKHFRPYSCDSSSWMSAARYGRAHLYVGHGKHVPVSRDTFRKLPDARTRERLRAMGVEPKELATEAAWRGGTSVATELTARTWVRMSAEMEQHLGVRLFIAAPRSGYVQTLRRAWEWQWEEST